MESKKIIRMAITLVVLFVVVFIGRRLVLGNSSLITLHSAPVLAGQITQALGPSANGSLLSEGRDYTLDSAYFDNGYWAVVSIKASDSKRSGIVVMKKNNGIYQAVVGPGTAIASTQLRGLPADVIVYLSTRVAIYNPVPGQK